MGPAFDPIPKREFKQGKGGKPALPERSWLLRTNGLFLSSETTTPWAAFSPRGLS
jgi:hypothetical protein